MRPLLVAAVTRAEGWLKAVLAYSAPAPKVELAQARERLAAARTLLALADKEWEREAQQPLKPGR
jgi:hypothetical protein